MVGRVTRVAADVRTYEVGDLVALEPQLAAGCGDCAECQAGTAWFCPRPAPLPVWGFAERIVVRAAGAWRLPAGLDPTVAALMEPMAVSLHALRITALCAERADDLTGVNVVVLGAGATGLLAVAAARHLGAHRVTCVARHDHQAELAARMGARVILRDGAADLEETLIAAEPHLVLECVGGRADTLGLAIRVAAPHGEVSVVGLFDEPQLVDSRSAFRREIRLVFPVVYGVVRGVHDYEIAARVLQDPSTPFADLITHRYPLEEIGQAYRTAGSKSAGAVRVIVTGTG